MATQPIYIYGDTCNAVLNTARSRVDDLVLTSAGAPTGTDPGQQETQVGGANLLAELEEDGTTLCLRTQIIFNSAWRKFQQRLKDAGWRGLIDTIIIPSLPANANPDPMVQTWISWNGCFDGNSFLPSPALPAEFLSPLRMRERVTSSSAPGEFRPMITALNGLRTVPRRSELNRQWEWKNNALWFMGATGKTDLQIRCAKFYGDFVATSNPTTPWYYRLVPIPRCLSALAWYVAYEVCVPRVGEEGSAGILNNAQTETDAVFNDQFKADHGPMATVAAPVEATA